MSINKVDLCDGFDSFDEHIEPRIEAELNGHTITVVKAEGEFPWHHHDGTYEPFYMFTGEIRIEIEDQLYVEVVSGELVVISADVEHRPVVDEGAENLLNEPTETRNTGNVEHEKTTETEDL